MITVGNVLLVWFTWVVVAPLLAVTLVGLVVLIVWVLARMRG